MPNRSIDQAIKESTLAPLGWCMLIRRARILPSGSDFQNSLREIVTEPGCRTTPPYDPPLNFRQINTTREREQPQDRTTGRLVICISYPIGCGLDQATETAHSVSRFGGVGTRTTGRRGSLEARAGAYGRAGCPAFGWGDSFPRPPRRPRACGWIGALAATDPILNSSPLPPPHTPRTATHSFRARGASLLLHLARGPVRSCFCG